jgi:macrolide-specific efflux system membrane fusion protein
MLMSHRALKKHFYSTFMLCVVFFFAGCQSIGPANAPSQEITPTPIPTEVVAVNPTFTVQKGEVVSQIRFTGRVAPVLSQDLFFRVDGRVRNIYFGRDTDVKAGSVIADLEIDALERQLKVEELDIQINQVHVDEAQIRLDYAEKANPSPDQEQNVALLKKELQLAQLNLTKSSLNIEDLKQTIQDSQITAPFDGHLISVSIEKGSAVAGYKPVVQIADLSKLEIASDLQGTELSQLAQGMPASMFFSNNPGSTFAGKIRQLPSLLDTSANSNVPVVDNVVHISVDTPDVIKISDLGDLIRVTVILEKRENVLWLPPQAIRNFEGRSFVLVQDGNLQKRVDVKIGLMGEDRYEIQDGLAEGQTVVAP